MIELTYKIHTHTYETNIHSINVKNKVNLIEFKSRHHHYKQQKQ